MPEDKEVTEAEKFNPKWLKGLELSTTEIRGKEKEKKRVPVTRPLKESDVLSWKIYGDEVAIVAADGKKHRVAK